MFDSFAGKLAVLAEMLVSAADIDKRLDVAMAIAADDDIDAIAAILVVLAECIDPVQPELGADTANAN
jgi:hypothetical protein